MGRMEPTSKLLARRPSRVCLTIDCQVSKRLALDKYATDSTCSSEGTLEQFHTLYEVLEQLGQGSISFASRALRRSDGCEVVVKVSRSRDPDLLEVARREYELLQSLDCPLVLKCIGFFEGSDRFVTVMEAFSSVTLEEAVVRAEHRIFFEDDARSVFRELLSALDFLHGRQIVHRDVKASNILVSEDCQHMRLIDFNTAGKLLEGDGLTMTGTMEWMAPEVLSGTSPNEQSEIYSAGLCLFFMLDGSLPVRMASFGSLEAFKNAVCTKDLALSSRIWSVDCKAVLGSCLGQADSRPPAADLLQAPWFKTVHKTC